MKKVMIGILILIPIIILVIVIAVSNFLKVAAWIAVDDVNLIDKSTGQTVESLTVVFPSEDKIRNFKDYIDVHVTPDYANRYTVEWSITCSPDDVMDAVYKKSYEDYLAQLEVYNEYLAKYDGYTADIHRLENEGAQAKLELSAAIKAVEEDESLIPIEQQAEIERLKEEFDEKQAEREDEIESIKAKRNALVEPELKDVAPPATCVDDNGNPVASNTSGKFAVNSYCRFTVTVQVESITKTFIVIAEGYNVESIEIVNVGDETNEVKVGEHKRVEAKFHPMSSIVTKTEWSSENPNIATVDANGIITGVSAGTTKIFVKANKKDNPDEFVTNEIQYTITVVAGASKFGEEFSTSKTSFTLAEIGLAAGDEKSYSGCAIENGIVSLTADKATIVTDKGTITINACEESAIAIKNADIYDAANGYVFAVSDLTLNLTALWADAFKSGTPDGVVWETSDSKVATVSDNGAVTARGSGLVEITATKDGKQAKVLLNVQVKVVSMSLRTSNESLQVGLARETVFAAEKFTDNTLNAVEPNGTYIRIIGAPQRAEGESDAEYYAKMLVFYSAYNFEVVEGKEFASFANTALNPTEFPNRLIFNPQALEGKGKQKITVKVSAKYPKYENETQLTSKTVDINVIYGVEISNIAELRKASAMQKEYAYRDGNLQPKEKKFEHFNTVHKGGEKERVDRYRTYNSAYSLKTYAICFVADVAFELNPDGTPVTIYDSNDVKVYGNVYGNGYRLSAERDQVHNVDAMFWVAWSNVTVSNLNIRANKLEKDDNLSANDTKGLKGECLQVFSTEGYQRLRTVNVRIEYCILENGRRAGQTYNADVTFDGIVVRNVDSTAFYIPARMTNYIDDDGQWTAFPNYSHINLNNCVFSNCISTIGSYSYERFTVMPKPGNGDDPHGDYEVGQGRFVRDDPVANEEHFRKYFIPEGINQQIRQTGFLDIYNWQDVNNASIIDVGDASLNDIIANASKFVLAENSLFQASRYVAEVENTSYFHVGLISTGISFGENIMDEESYLDVVFEDPRMTVHIDMRKIKAEGNGIASAAADILKDMEINMYGYSNKADITPYSTYEINREFINRLHQGK